MQAGRISGMRVVTVPEAEQLLQELTTKKTRDDVVRCAYVSGVPKMRIHELTGLARDTIDRILAKDHDDDCLCTPPPVTLTCRGSARCRACQPWQAKSRRGRRSATCPARARAGGGGCARMTAGGVPGVSRAAPGTAAATSR